MNKTKINIFGAGRSGTTMLDLMLGNDSQSFSMGEVRAWFRPFRKHHFQIDCNCGNADCQYWAKVKDLNESEFINEAFEKWDVNFIIDSSKHIPWMIDSFSWTEKYGIENINFIIYKPLINYIYSIWKRGENINNAVYRYKLYYKRFFESGIDAYAINFQELVLKPNETLDLITDITKQPKVNNRANFWEKNHHHLFGSGGTRNQTRNRNSEIRKKDEFSNEFKEMIPDIERKIALDKELMSIKKKLKEIDIKTRKKELKHNIKKPYWYYYLKFKNKLFSKFPNSSNTRF